MIKRFNQFITEDNSGYLMYYAFDWDDNILYMPTEIHMERKEGDDWVPEDVSTAKFAQVRTDKENYRLAPDAFSNFRDDGPMGDSIFLDDVKKAISQGKLGPAWNDFIECLTHGALFAIITARGHESPTMRNGVAWIIDNILNEDQIYSMYNHLVMFAYHFNPERGEQVKRILTGKPSENELVREYLENCEFVGVSAPSRGGSPANPEAAKEEALLEFKDRINDFAAKRGLKAKIGFSDDDLKNVKHIEDLADNLSRERFPNIAEFTVKGTKDPENITKKITTYESQSSWSGGAGDPMSSSVVPFTSFNTIAGGEVTGNLSFGGSENRQDAFGDRLKKQTKFLSKASKDLFGEKKRKKKPGYNINPVNKSSK